MTISTVRSGSFITLRISATNWSVVVPGNRRVLTMATASPGITFGLMPELNIVMMKVSRISACSIGASCGLAAKISRSASC